MTFAGWMTVVGALLLTMALSSAFLRNLAISTSAIYLAAGIALGPLVFGLVRLDIGASVGWFERLRSS